LATRQPSQKKQPQRFDSFLLGVDTGINTVRGDDLEPELLGVGAQGGVERRPERRSFAEIRGGQYGYDWDNGVNGTGLRYEDIGNNLIFGRNRNWRRERRRNQVLGSASLFKDTSLGEHNIKVGGEVFYETVNDIYIDGYEEDILHVMQNNAKLDVICFQPASRSAG
jgi:hypothetical protein